MEGSGNYLRGSLMPFLILALVAGLIAWICFRVAKTIDRRRKRRAEEIQRRFRPDDLFCEEQHIGFKFASQEFVIGTICEAHVYRFDEMTRCELVRNGVSVISTNRGSQIGGALIGGAILGIPGLLIGGLSGSKSSVENVKSVVLKVHVNDPENPFHEVCFFAAGGQGQKPGILNQNAIALAERFYGHCLNAMKPAVAAQDLGSDL